MKLPSALFMAAALAACGQQPSAPEVTGAWTRDTAGGIASAAVFMTIASPAADRLVAASTPVAGETDLMTMQVEDDTMKMIYLDDIAIPPNTRVLLDPAGLHVWLADLDQPLRAGESFPLTLEFEKAGRREIRVPVIGPAAPPPMPDMGM